MDRSEAHVWAEPMGSAGGSNVECERLRGNKTFPKGWDGGAGQTEVPSTEMKKTGEERFQEKNQWMSLRPVKLEK